MKQNSRKYRAPKCLAKCPWLLIRDDVVEDRSREYEGTICEDSRVDFGGDLFRDIEELYFNSFDPFRPAFECLKVDDGMVLCYPACVDDAVDLETKLQGNAHEAGFRNPL